jgi:hypothetical protein
MRYFGPRNDVRTVSGVSAIQWIQVCAILVNGKYVQYCVCAILLYPYVSKQAIPLFSKYPKVSMYPCTAWRHSSCIRFGACLAPTSRLIQKEAPNSGYRDMESDERARSVTERRQYHRVLPGRPHNAQSSTHWPSFIVHTLWSVTCFNVQTVPEGGSEQWISRHGVG